MLTMVLEDKKPFDGDSSLYEDLKAHIVEYGINGQIIGCCNQKITPITKEICDDGKNTQENDVIFKIKCRL